MEDMSNAYKMFKKPEEKQSLGGPEVNGKIILKWIS
jgi:hypothetical protein